MTSFGTEGAGIGREVPPSSTPPVSNACEAPIAARQPEARTPPPGYREAGVEWSKTASTVVRALFDALNEESVRYCHWKSNIRLGETLAGDQDIDLLVDRRDLAKLHAVMARCGFKTTVARDGLGHPGVFHALALNETRGHLVDLHVYHGVVSGDSLVKTYRFPFSAALLDHTTMLADVRVPRPELELLMFVVRIALKHTGVIEILKVNRKYHATALELAWLQRAADVDEVEKLRRRHFPWMSACLYHSLLEAVADEDAVFKRIVLGRRLAKTLRPFRRMGPVSALASRLWRVFCWLRDKARRRGGLSMSSGGAIVALVGPKGTGKSTLSGHVSARLGRHLAIQRIHAGKPPATFLSFLPRLCLPLARKLFPHERLSMYEGPARRERRTYSLFHVARMTLLAYDRARLLSRAFRAAASGFVVVSDRYPSPTRGAIDSRSFNDETLAATTSWAKQMLMRWERSLYRNMPAPDIVLRLNAPIEVAISRDATRCKASGPDSAAVQRRWKMESIGEHPSAHVVVVDTTGPIDDTIRLAVAAVWKAL